MHKNNEDQIDSLDEQIIEELFNSGRDSARKLSKKLSISPATLISRVNRLEKIGIIKSYGAIIDYLKLGYEFIAIIEITIKKGKLLETEQEISKLAGVVSVYDVTGLTDSIVLTRCKNRLEFSRLIKKINSLEFVERTNTHVILNIIKEENRKIEQTLNDK